MKIRRSGASTSPSGKGPIEETESTEGSKKSRESPEQDREKRSGFRQAIDDEYEDRSGRDERYKEVDERGEEVYANLPGAAPLVTDGRDLEALAEELVKRYHHGGSQAGREAAVLILRNRSPLQSWETNQLGGFLRERSATARFVSSLRRTLQLAGRGPLGSSDSPIPPPQQRAMRRSPSPKPPHPAENKGPSIDEIASASRETPYTSVPAEAKETETNSPYTEVPESSEATDPARSRNEEIPDDVDPDLWAEGEQTAMEIFEAGVTVGPDELLALEEEAKAQDLPEDYIRGMRTAILRVMAERQDS